MPEMWARCGPCSRWFYVPFSTGETMARAHCPVCSSAPSRFEVRIAKPSFDVEIADGGAATA